MPKIGVVLSGCGVFDGSEIHEAVLTLLALDRLGAEIVCLAPNVEFPVVDHRRREPSGETRNALVEAARIARGEIRDLADVTPDELDGAVFPGGFGAAKVLSDFAAKGADCTVHPEVERLVRGLHAAGKPIGCLCIAPATIARILGGGVALTIGSDPATAQAIDAAGARHRRCAVGEIVKDEQHKVVSSPAYMLGASIKDIAPGIEQLCRAVVEWA